MNIAIIGAGVAGLSSAIALKQKGFDVNVYERGESISHLGAGVILWPNATYVLHQLGILDKLKKHSGLPKQMRRLTPSGKDLGSINVSAINRNMGFPSLSVLRRDLMSTLKQKLYSLDVTIQYGHKVKYISTSTEGLASIHCDNTQSITADLIIGADGRMASCTRQYIQDDNQAVYQGFINWIGVCQFKHNAFKDCIIEDYWGTGERFGIVPVSQDTAYWAGGIVADKIQQNNPQEYKYELTQLFSQWPEIIPHVIGHTPADQINKIYVHDHNPAQVWHKNNVIMIGDAAHAPLPTSGQGACQALEDAWHLSHCLNGIDGLDNALNKFTQLRLAKTTQIIMTGRHLASSIFSRDCNIIERRNEESRNTDFIHLANAMAKGWSAGLPL